MNLVHKKMLNLSNCFSYEFSKIKFIQKSYGNVNDVNQLCLEADYVYPQKRAIVSC